MARSDTDYIPKFEDAIPVPKFENAIPIPKKGDPSTLDSIGEALKNAYTNTQDASIAAMHGGAKFATAGMLPVFAGASGALGSTIKRAALDNTFDLGDVKKDYLSARDQVDAMYNKAYNDHPVAYGLGAATGAIASPLNQIAPFSADKYVQGLKAAHVAEKGAEAALPFMTSLQGYLAKTGAGAANAGLAGLMIDPGNTKGVIDPLQLDKRLDNANTGLKIGGAISGVVNALPGPKKAMSSLLGPSEESIDKYVTGRDRINKAPKLEALKDSVDGQLQSLRDTVSTNEEAVKNAQSRIKDELTSVPNPQTVTPDVHDAVGVLKNQVVEESAKARDILEKSGDQITIEPIMNVIDDAIEKHMIGGNQPGTESAKASVARLQALKESYLQYPKQLSGPDAKRLVQQLDEEAQYLRSKGEFSDSYSNAVKNVRRTIDEQLKHNDAYREQMARVSERTGLLDEANRLFGGETRAYSSMGSISSPGRVPQRETLQRLGEMTNQDFKTPVENYMNAQSSLKKELPKIFAELPEQQAYNQAKQNAEPFKAWTQQGSQTKLQSLINKPKETASIEAQRELEALDRLLNRTPEQPSYLQSIDDMRVLQSFGRNYTQGSRRSQMFRGMGEVAGGALGSFLPGGHLYSKALGGAGAMVGGVMDVAGGKTAKGLIDLYLDHPDNFKMIQSLKQNQVLSPWLQLRKLDAQPNR